MDDGASLPAECADANANAWIEAAWNVAGLFLFFAVMLLAMVVASFAVRDWRREKQHRWPK